ncbi:MAG: hypothetical protein J5537_07725 [Lachnospiraceae bacterium]|nr:hypothetical protein [Lachnospiraceae bacterium]
MSRYVIGIDGGGTGSKGIVADLEGNILCNMKGGPINYVGADTRTIDENIENLIEQGLKGREVSDCAAICIGSAGVSRSDVLANFERILEKTGFTCPHKITTDSHTAHAGALNGKEGIVVIAGTGAICLGVNKEGDSIRVGGYGHIIDDEGSAYYIGRLILRAVIRAFDGRDKKTVLSELVFEKLGISTIPELITWIYSTDRSKGDIAALAILIEEAYERGDEVAGEIEEKAAEELAKLCEPALEFLGGKATIAVSGSVLQKNRRIRESFKERLKDVEVIQAMHEADYGAMLLALKMAK